MEKLQLLYQQMIEDDELMKELEDIIHYAESRIKKTITNGTEIYEKVEEMITIVPVGLIPLDVQEGYFFLSIPNNKTTRIYHYRLSIFTKHDEKYRSMKTEFVEARQRSFVHTYESIKSELIKTRKDFPNPAVYSIESELALPLDETLLPIAKRTLVRYISSSAA